MALIPIFEASTTVPGVGHIDEISALYGLMWNTPNFMMGIIGRLSGNPNMTGTLNLERKGKHISR